MSGLATRRWSVRPWNAVIRLAAGRYQGEQYLESAGLAFRAVGNRLYEGTPLDMVADGVIWGGGRRGWAAASGADIAGIGVALLRDKARRRRDLAARVVNSGGWSRSGILRREAGGAVGEEVLAAAHVAGASTYLVGI